MLGYADHALLVKALLGTFIHANETHTCEIRQDMPVCTEGQQEILKINIHVRYRLVNLVALPAGVCDSNKLLLPTSEALNL
jgi:hypothetical protein